MSKLWDFISSKYLKKVGPNPKVPLIHEEYILDFNAPAYIAYKSSDRFSALKKALYNAYIDALTSYSSENISFSMQDKFSGIHIKPHESIQSKTEFLQLQKYITEQTKSLGYFVQMSEIRTRQINDSLQTIYNVYMKPSHRFKVEIPADQRYGNIQVELSIRQDSIEFLRVKNMVYSDRNYKEPLAYGEWVKAVFG